MAKADIGLIDCPICAKSGAHVRETDKGRAYILCEECNVQIFARGAESDRAIRAAMAGVAPASAPVEVAPAPVEKSPEKPAEESTIFDYILPKKRVSS